MIVAETPTAYQFVTQPDHARLAGQFAEHWGGPTFDRPSPFAAVVAATHAHDDGWHAYDRQPHLDDGRPVGFTSMPASTWIELYDRGIDAVVDLDRYAGLLVSMHGAGLRRRRYGLSPSWGDTPPAFESFVARQEARQRELVDDLLEAGDDRVSAADATLLTALHETGTPDEGSSSRLWANYRLLQAWDALSLSFCTTVSPPGNEEIAGVPRGAGRPEETLSLAALGDGGYGVAPYPFETDPLVVRVAARTVEKASFDAEAALVDAYYAAGLDVVELVLRPLE